MRLRSAVRRISGSRPSVTHGQIPSNIGSLDGFCKFLPIAAEMCLHLENRAITQVEDGQFRGVCRSADIVRTRILSGRFTNWSLRCCLPRCGARRPFLEYLTHNHPASRFSRMNELMNIPKILRTILVLGVALGQTDVSRADVINMLDSASFDTRSGRGGDTLHLAALSASSPGFLTTDYSGLGDTPLTVTFDTGTRVGLTTSTATSLSFSWLHGSSGSKGVNLKDFGGLHVTFLDYVGDTLSAPSNQSLLMSFDGGADVALRMSYLLPAGFSASFTGISVSGNVPALYEGNMFDTLNAEASIRAAYADNDPTSAGQFFGPVNAATAVPEPSSFALLGLGAIGVFFRRRRKAAKAEAVA